MKIPMSPPSLDEFYSEMFSDEKNKEKLLLIVNSSIGPYDEKGRYLHWNKIRHLEPPEGYDSELYWMAMRHAREKISKKLLFKDKFNSCFKYSMPDIVMRDVMWISENASGAIEAGRKIPNPKTQKTYLINSLIEEAINSSQLEGASTTKKVAKDMLRTGRDPLNHSETMILNNYRAMKFVREYKEESLTQSMIFELHKILTEGTLEESDIGKAGVFRGSDDNIAVYSYDDVLLHSPPKSKELSQRLQLICDFANKTREDSTTYIPPIIRAIIVHFMIGYDHPFIDGNGRTARALFYWVMVKEGYWLMEHISISRIIKKAPAKYMYAYLHTETDANDTTYFIVHQLEVIKEAINDLHKYLKKKSEELIEAETVLDHSPLQGLLNYRQLSILKNAIKNPGAEYTINSHKSSHGVSYQTARTDLLKLSDEYKVLKKYKVGKKDIFIAPVDLNELLQRKESE